MIYLNVILTVRAPAEVARVRDLLAETARRSAQEPGCERFEIYQSDADSQVFLLVERWQDQAALDAHRAGVTFQTFYTPNVLPLVDRSPHPSTRIA